MLNKEMLNKQILCNLCHYFKYPNVLPYELIYPSVLFENIVEVDSFCDKADEQAK